MCLCVCHHQWTHQHSDAESTLCLCHRTHIHTCFGVVAVWLLWCVCCRPYVILSPIHTHTHTMVGMLMLKQCGCVLVCELIFLVCLCVCLRLKHLVHKCLTLMAFTFGLFTCVCVCMCVSNSGCDCVRRNVIHCFDYVIAECTAPSGTSMRDKSSKTSTHTHTHFPACFSLRLTPPPVFFFYSFVISLPLCCVVIATPWKCSTHTHSVKLYASQSSELLLILSK